MRSTTATFPRECSHCVPQAAGLQQSSCSLLGCGRCRVFGGSCASLSGGTEKRVFSVGPASRKSLLSQNRLKQQHQHSSYGAGEFQGQPRDGSRCPTPAIQVASQGSQEEEGGKERRGSGMIMMMMMMMMCFFTCCYSLV